MRTRATKRTIRRLGTPLAKELAQLANALSSAKLHALAEKVAAVERRAQALDNFMVAYERDGIEEEPS